MTLLFENCEIQADRRELRRDSTVVHVEPQVFDVLVYLVRHRDRVVSKDELIRSVWEGRFVSDDTLASRVSAARRAIGDTGAEQRLIRTATRRAFESFVDDLETVVNECGLDRFALLGISQGAPVSIAYAVRHPERVSRLVLCGGFAKGWRRRGSSGDIARAEASVTLIREGWGQDNPAARQMFTSLIVPDATHEEMQWFNELERISASADTAIRLLHVLGDIDVTPLLPRVAAPTLVLHSRGDARVPFEHGLMLARGIPDARFVALESKNHLILSHEPAWPRFIDEICGFLSEDEPERLSAGAAGF